MSRLSLHPDLINAIQRHNSTVWNQKGMRAKVHRKEKRWGGGFTINKELRALDWWKRDAIL